MNKDLYCLKKKQREKLSKKRLILNNSVKLNNIFYKKLSQYEWFNESKIIASFLSIKSEIPTKDINEYFRYLGKTLCLPVIKNDDDVLLFKSYSQGDKLKKGKFGVNEPVNTKPYLPDIIFVPCLAFDTNGFRLGYGGGYYDKSISFLNSINHKFISIGLAYEEQKVKNVVHDSLDQKINYILTEKQIYKIV